MHSDLSKIGSSKTDVHDAPYRGPSIFGFFGLDLDIPILLPDFSVILALFDDFHLLQVYLTFNLH